MRARFASGIILKDGNILLIRRVNKGNKYYTLPGGGLEEGETFEENALREVREETSIEASINKFLYKIDWNNGKENYYFLCNYIKGEPHLPESSVEFEKMKGGEQIYDPQWFPVKDLPNIRMYPLEIRDLLTEHIKNGYPAETIYLQLTSPD